MDLSQSKIRAAEQDLLLNSASDGSEATEDAEEEDCSCTLQGVDNLLRGYPAMQTRSASPWCQAEDISGRSCEELEPLKMKLQHSQEKVEMLEQAAKNQQQIFQVQMDLMDQSRSQHQAQLQETGKQAGQ
eukprot:Skav204611  [mRNA]  locus=scaffold1712:83040:86517:+ [translate_table: standard]